MGGTYIQCLFISQSNVLVRQALQIWGMASQRSVEHNDSRNQHTEDNTSSSIQFSMGKKSTVPGSSLQDHYSFA